LRDTVIYGVAERREADVGGVPAETGVPVRIPCAVGDQQFLVVYDQRAAVGYGFVQYFIGVGLGESVVAGDVADGQTGGVGCVVI
jgi:hypothetical protein